MGSHSFTKATVSHTVKGRQPYKRDFLFVLWEVSLQTTEIFIYIFLFNLCSIVHFNVGWYLMLARMSIIDGGNSREAYWCCVCLFEAVYSRYTFLMCALQSMCFVCVRVVHLLGKSVTHVIYNLKIYQLSSDTPTEHLGCWPIRDALVSEATQGCWHWRSVNFVFFTCTHARPQHCFMSAISCPVLRSLCSRSCDGIIMNSVLHCCIKFWPSVFIIITNSVNN